MPRSKKDTIEVTGWDYKSPMNAKTVLGDKYDPTKHYRFVRPDNVERMKEGFGYGVVSDKKFKEMVLMETSKENHIAHQDEVKARVKARQGAFDAQLRREVEREGRGKVDFED